MYFGVGGLFMFLAPAFAFIPDSLFNSDLVGWSCMGVVGLVLLYIGFLAFRKRSIRLAIFLAIFVVLGIIVANVRVFQWLQGIDGMFDFLYSSVK